MPGRAAGLMRQAAGPIQAAGPVLAASPVRCAGPRVRHASSVEVPLIRQCQPSFLARPTTLQEGAREKRTMSKEMMARGESWLRLVGAEEGGGEERRGIC